MITNKEVRISVNKTLTKKLIYIVAALAMLAMLIPAMAVPVSAGNTPTISLQIYDPVSDPPLATDNGYNVEGSTVLATLSDSVTGNWSLVPATGVANIISPVTNVNSVLVQGNLGEVVIHAVTANGVANADKKFVLIQKTDFTTSPAGSGSAVTWNESTKAWEAGPVKITDTVTGAFPGGPNPVQGVILNWYLFPASLNIDLSPGEWLDHGSPNIQGLKNRMLGYLTTSTVNQVSFKQWTVPANSAETSTRTWTNISGTDGSNFVQLYARGEEAVKIVVVPEYPEVAVQKTIWPEITTWDFYTTENEVVPQVRWAGEKIVLEKNFGSSYEGQWVKFSLQNQSVGSLEGISGNSSISDSSVWTLVDHNGFASAILVSSDEGVSNVTAGLYDAVTKLPIALDNQHFFTVYFLKMESITLGDVPGKRVGDWNAHDSGWWTTANPWDTTADTTTQTLNVSQDALLRAKVKGWFTSSNPSWRPARYVDPYNSSIDQAANTPGSLLLPAGRWILPDDWATLAGPNWEISRLHWDIMSNPDGVVVAEDPLGAYFKWIKDHDGKDIKITADNIGRSWPVVGPFSPGLELMTTNGWKNSNDGHDANRKVKLVNGVVVLDTTGTGIQTVVPDGKLNVWDAPMPSAKIIFQIQKSESNTGVAGYFKSAMKTDIYYLGTVKVDAKTGIASVSYTYPGVTSMGQPVVVKGPVYTNPFYQALIPAHESIPCFINNGGYDWNSFLPSYGPYKFWTIINQSAYKPLVATSDPAGHPTVVEVYSDNHGEAMVWLNGNWNLALGSYVKEGITVDIAPNTNIATTTIQATADYPYSRGHQVFQSNKDTKTWWWGGQILGTDEHQYWGPSGNRPKTLTSDTRMVLSVGGFIESSIQGTAPNQSALSPDKMIWVWVTDRDQSRRGVNGAKVTWSIAQTGLAQIASDPSGWISTYNYVTQNITLENGFLNGTHGIVTDGIARHNGESTLRVPTSYEVELFNKFWGTNGTSTIRADAANYVVAAVKIQSLDGLNPRVSVKIDITSHDFDFNMPQTVPATITYYTNVDFAVRDALDDGLRLGDANCDGVVNMGDVTAVERMILGYNGVTSNAIVNSDGTVDMGTVVKIERTILGLP